MRRRVVYLLVLLLGLSVILSGCSSPKPSTQSTQINITDTLGRQVNIDKTADKVVAIGPGALRLCCYFNEPAIFAGIEQMEIDNPTGRPYLYANPTLTSLPVIGAGGPNNAPDPERILLVKPDVIFTTYNADQAAANNLQTKTGIPVVVLSYGNTATFDPQVNESLILIGKVIGREQKAQDLVAMMNDFQNDLEARTKDILSDEKPTAYVGGLGMKGSHGIESTQANYSLFNAVHARNVADETGKTGSVIIDKEQLVKWNPDKVFIDAAGYPLVLENYGKTPHFYQALSAVNNGELYQILPYNFYTTNIDTAIADAYFIGKTLYPQQFMDVDPEQKADEIYKLLLGKEMYAQMVQDYGGFKKLSLP